MSRSLSSLFVLLAFAASAFAEPRPPAVERAAALQRAMADARDALDARKPAQAAAILEAQLANAEGNKAFLGLLRDVYTEELRTMGTAPRAAMVRERLILLGGTPSAEVLAEAPKPSAAPERDLAREAALAFQQEKWADASKLFADAAKAGILSPAETAAWEYARKKSGSDAPETNEPLNAAPSAVAEAGTSESQVITTASFHIRYSGSKESAESFGKAAEAKRKELFARWSGPVTTGWEPKCEIVLHRDAEAYAKASKRPAGGVGHATVRFTAEQVSERKLDLRADDATLLEDALPRELTHVILADLFPLESPPLWAESGMAVLAASGPEVDRYSRTLHRCARDGELFAVASLLELKEYPGADKITGFYCQSVSLVEYLVKLRGERNFTIFLRDTKRYGIASALKKTYDLDGPAALEREWKQRVLATPRAQAP